MATQAFKGDRWVPAIPLLAPVDVRWCCEHQWTPHVHDNGIASHLRYDCLRCGASTGAGSPPADGCWPIRAWLARHVTPYGRQLRRAEKKVTGR